MEMKDKIFKLKGKVQHYAWGGFEYIPNLLGIKNGEHQPCAEYWLGAHSSASARVLFDDGTSKPLYNLVQDDPTSFINDEVYTNFHELPYLLKILDVNEMLSIQVHPSKEEALKGFEKEEAAGISINGPHRNYKDKNHKPEVMVALSEFWLLHGFKNEGLLKKVLHEIKAFNFLEPVFKKEGYYGMYKHVMEMPQQKVDEVLSPLIKSLQEHPAKLLKTEPGYWALKVFENGQPLQNIDRGIFSIYFFNIMQVQPGEAVFQGAGIPHAYLQGQNVELMANSDNVLRGGLTPKHIDVPELLKHTLFKPVDPVVLKGEAKPGGELNYPCPVADFGLSAIKLQKGESYQAESKSAEIFIVIEGEITIDPKGLHLYKGEAFIILPATSYKISFVTNALVYKTFVP